MSIRSHIIMNVNYRPLHSDGTYSMCVCHREMVATTKRSFVAWNWISTTFPVAKWLVTQFLTLTGIQCDTTAATTKLSCSFRFHQCIKHHQMHRFYAKMDHVQNNEQRFGWFAKCIHNAVHCRNRVQNISTIAEWYTFFTPRYFVRNLEKFMDNK